VVRVFEHLLSLEHVDIEDRDSVERAVGNLQQGLDFADALHHASSRTCEAFLTFDAKRFAGKARRLAITPPVRLAG
jgi:predicted nucleic-acid-binding protein